MAVRETSREQVELVKDTIAREQNLTDNELRLLLYTATRLGLDPLAKQIYAVRRKGKIVIQTGIDGFRAIAARTGEYAGSDDAVFDDEAKPKKATVTVYRLVGGQRCPFTASARWDQYYPGEDLGFLWRKMPHVMLGKCAEGLALRKAFPAQLSGLYTDDEMAQAGPPEELPAPTVPLLAEHGGSRTTARAGARAGSVVAGVQPAPMPPPPTESLDDFPRAFKEDEIPALPPANMPENWREEWPWGSLKGRQLWTLSTEELHTQLGWAQKANRGKNLWPILEEILKSRGGV